MVEINNVTFAYKKGKILFEDLNISLKPGHIYGLLGRNGAGKSTLIKNITGLVFPEKGICTINGRDSSQRSPDLLQDFFLIPEEIYLPTIKIEKFMRSTGGFYPKFKESEFIHCLKEFDLDMDDNISSLSFGQQKKVMIAFALATNTDVLIIDEPTNGLDIPSKAQFRKIVSGALTENRCMIISTHQVRDLDNLIDALIILSERRIILNSSVDDIAQKLLFSTLSSLENQEVLYSENTIKGYSVIIPNTSGRSSKVDLELLFNGLIDNKNQIMHELNPTRYE
ncbi:MAG: ABC transporter ATP-binding protein [Daejeonella sp.]